MMKIELSFNSNCDTRRYSDLLLSKKYIFTLSIIGTGETVKNMKYLQDIGVTHVLNTAETDVNINPQRFKDKGICYKGFRLV